MHFSAVCRFIWFGYVVCVIQFQVNLNHYSINMKKYFNIVTLNVEFQFFVSFLRKEHLPNDKKSHIARLLRGYIGGLKQIA